MPSAADIFNGMMTSPISPWNLPRTLRTAPQGSFEPDLIFNMRSLNLPAPPMASNVQGALGNAASIFGSPGTRALARMGPQSAPVEDISSASLSPVETGGGADSYKSPLYDQIETKLADAYGNPTIAGALRLLRTQGERSNAGAVSSAGARTVYQISPKTREGIMKQHGFDPWASPYNAGRAAVIALTTYTGPKADYSDPNVLAKAAGGYFGGKAGADNPNNMKLSDGATTVAEYVKKVVAPQLVNPYDMSFDKAALGRLEQGRQAALTPQDIAFDRGPAPAVPKPTDIPFTDFSKTDAALEAMRPKPLSDEEKKGLETNGFWQGLARAAMSSGGNEGLGTFLLHLGAGALGGKMAGREEIRQEMKSYEDKLARFQAAVFENDWSKAKIHHEELKQQAEQTDNYNMSNWKMAYDRWSKNGVIDISGTNAVIRTEDPNGKGVVRVLPLQGAINSAFAQQEAGVLSGMGGRQMAGNQQISGVVNGLITRGAIAEMSRPTSGGGANGVSDAAATAAPAFYGSYIAQNGLTADLLGEDAAKSLEDTTQKKLMSMGLQPGSKEWVERRDRLVAEEIAKLGLADPGMMQKMLQVGRAASAFDNLDVIGRARTTTTTNAKGQQTTSTSMPAASVFDSDAFNEELAGHGYSRY